MDLLAKGLKKAAVEIDKAAGLSGENSLGNFANQAQNAYNNAVGNTSSAAVKSAPVSNGKTTPANVLASGNAPIGAMKTAVNEFSEPVSKFEIPESFVEFDSHAEPEMCHLYMYDDGDDEDIDLNKPVICITPEDYAFKAVESYIKTGTPSGVDWFEPVNCGKMLFKAKKNDYYGQVVYFYGFQRGTVEKLGFADYMGLSMVYCRDVVGTPLEEKLIRILDHAAQTYTEE